MNPWIAVFFGGGVGSVLRFSISVGLTRWMPKAVFPWATFAANLAASALLALLIYRWGADAPDRFGTKALLAIGFCGGLSTFSTFSYENFILLRDGLYTFAIANVLVNVLICLALFYMIVRFS